MTVSAASTLVGLHGWRGRGVRVTCLGGGHAVGGNLGRGGLSVTDNASCAAARTRFDADIGRAVAKPQKSPNMSAHKGAHAEGGLARGMLARRCRYAGNFRGVTGL